MQTVEIKTAVVETGSAAGIVWDLRDLYENSDDPALSQDLAEALAKAQRFEQRYRGHLAKEISSPELYSALTELERIYEQMDKPLHYAGLLHAQDTQNPRHGALLQFAQEHNTQIRQHLLFFELEWMDLPDAKAQKYIQAPELERYRHYLERVRLFKPHKLSEPEEKLLDLKANTGARAFQRLFSEQVAGMTMKLGRGKRAQTVNLDRALALLHDPDRKARRGAAQAVTSALKSNERILTYIFNTLVFDHKVNDGLRRFPTPMASRHLANEIEPQTVDALMTACEQGQEIVRRYYALKKRLLKLRTLYDYDRYAPLFSDLPTCAWGEAKRVVLEAYTDFSPQTGAIVREFFDKTWIDAEVRLGKTGGAFSASTVPSVHPYILMNYTDRLRDAMTLAHELGHGVHQYLSRRVGYLQYDTPLTTAEMASTFGEILTFRRLLKETPDARTRLALICGKIEDSFATIFRQIVLTRFEQRLHEARRTQGELTAAQISPLWLEANRAMFGDSVKMTDDYGWWWLYIGHFIHVPFYCYAYAFGELLVLALYQKYLSEGEAFVPKYLEVLSAGGSESPPKLLAPLGVNINDPNFWQTGLEFLRGLVREAQELAEQV
jgi:oligoendopeptidase F